MSTHSTEFGDCVAKFLTTLKIDVALPEGVEILQPYAEAEVLRVVRAMCETYYVGNQPRVAIWGINPGRFGAGITGLSFTDPHAVSNLLGIPTTLTGRRELSAEYVQQVIEAYGGAGKFYADFYLTALSPLGFLAGEKNLNFYEVKELQQILTPVIQTWVTQQIRFGLRNDVTIVLGTGALQSFFEKHVREQCGFNTVLYLEHPRYIMQYKRRLQDTYIDKYVATLRQALEA